MADDAKYFRKKTTNAIHLVGIGVVKPAKTGSSQCGQPLEGMTEMTKREVYRAKDFEFCIKCCQLLGRVIA